MKMEKAKDLKNANEELRNVQKAWAEQYLQKYISLCEEESSAYHKDKGSKRNGFELSCPFCMGVTQEYIANKDNKKKIMIVGQQPLGFGCWNDHIEDFYSEDDKNEWSHIGLQNWAIEYLKTQLGNKTERGIKYNSSPFWRLFRALKENYALCWNDIDKVYYGKKDNDFHEGTLTYEAERFLSAPFEYKGKKISLVKREIEIARPDVVIFATGPSYALSMAIALDYEYPKKPINSIKNIHLRQADPVKELDSIKLDDKIIKVLWTYHPGYLTQTKYRGNNLFNEAIGRIKSKLEDLNENKS